MDSYYQRSQRFHHEEKHYRSHRWIILGAIVLVYCAYCLFRPIAPLAIVEASPSATSGAAPINLPWPAGAESAIGTTSDGVLATSSSSEKPLPTASIAKLITALTILRDFPLSLGQQGPTITLGANDVAIFDKYYSEGGSLVKVAAGEQISEHQALEAMLLPSANNMADSLAIWAYGSLAKYRVAAQSEVNSLGLTHTTVGVDASGFDPSTTSTPGDLVKLGRAVMANPLLAQIVGEQAATVPVAGVIHNTDIPLNSAGIVGIKTGNSDEAGGCYLFAANYKVDDKYPVTIIGAIQHAADLTAAMQSGVALLTAAKTNFSSDEYIKTGQTVASFTAPWLASPVPINAQYGLTLAVWHGHEPKEKIETKTYPAPTIIKPGSEIAAGTSVGKITVGSGVNTVTTALVAGQPVPTAGFTWRLTHPF